MSISTEAFEIAVEADPNIQIIRDTLSAAVQKMEHVVEM